MLNSKKKNKWLGVCVVVFLIWFVMNIRVEAGISSTFERAIDGLVGIAIVLGFVFLALDFFKITGNDGD